MVELFNFEGACHFEQGDFNVPAIGDPIEKWRDFSKTANWKIVSKVFWNFIPAAYGEKEEYAFAIWGMLLKRLTQFELPRLTSDFLRQNAENCLFVENGASPFDIKMLCEEFCKDKDFPKFVVEGNGNLRGFAICRNLIIVGVTVERMPPHLIIDAVSRQGLSLLNQREAKHVEAVMPKLAEMMTDAQVPNLENVDFWMLKPKSNGKSYEVWDRWRNNLNSIAFNDRSVIVAKI